VSTFVFLICLLIGAVAVAVYRKLYRGSGRAAFMEIALGVAGAAIAVCAIRLAGESFAQRPLLEILASGIGGILLAMIARWALPGDRQ
jgi:uncharacterized membrane protein YeaQ/YmgE (transglycosylase-associated protein family)